MEGGGTVGWGMVSMSSEYVHGFHVCEENQEKGEGGRDGYKDVEGEWW